MTRIRVQLDDPRAKLTLWSTQVEGPSAKGGQLRDRVAGAAGEAIYAAFEPRAQGGLKVDPAAVALFIKAEGGVKSPQLLKEGEPVRAAQEATALAPDFAAARGLLALALVESAVLTSSPRAPAAAETRAIAEAQRAIRTSPA